MPKIANYLKILPDEEVRMFYIYERKNCIPNLVKNKLLNHSRFFNNA